MQQGWVARLLVISLLSISPVYAAKELSAEVVKQWQQTPQITQEVAKLLNWVVRDEVEKLKDALEKMPLKEQEVVKYRLLDKLEQQSIMLTPKMALLMEVYSQQHPHYLVVEQGDGYEFTSPAFHYPAIAKRLLKAWQQDQQVLDLILMAERRELVLLDWLQGPLHVVKEREALLMRELGNFSADAVWALTLQITKAGGLTRLPSHAVLVRLAQVSDSDELYDLLWRLKPDRHIRRELDRLSRLGDSQSIERLVRASENPSLNKEAIRLLTRINPLSEPVKTLMLKKLGTKDSASWVALELANHGHQAWLHELLQSEAKLQRDQVKQALQ